MNLLKANIVFEKINLLIVSNFLSKFTNPEIIGNKLLKPVSIKNLSDQLNLIINNSTQKKERLIIDNFDFKNIISHTEPNISVTNELNIKDFENEVFFKSKQPSDSILKINKKEDSYNIEFEFLNENKKLIDINLSSKHNLFNRSELGLDYRELKTENFKDLEIEYFILEKGGEGSPQSLFFSYQHQQQVEYFTLENDYAGNLILSVGNPKSFVWWENQNDSLQLALQELGYRSFQILRHQNFNK